MALYRVSCLRASRRMHAHRARVRTSGKKPKSAKEQVIENFNGGWFDGTAANYCTEDAMFNPPGITFRYLAG